MTDTFDAVLAEMHTHIESGCACCQARDFRNRLAAAHAAEVAELQRIIREHFSRAEREMTDRFHAETRAEAAERDAKEVVARLEWLESCSDAEMRDGDTARVVASELLANFRTHTEQADED